MHFGAMDCCKNLMMIAPFALLLLTVLTLSLGGLTACNTVEGIGEDLQNAGRAIDDAAS